MFDPSASASSGSSASPAAPATGANSAQPLRWPAAIVRARRKAWALVAVLALLMAASVASLDLRWHEFFSADALASMGRFVAEFFPPDTRPAFLARVVAAALETLAMSALGTWLAAIFGMALALPASRHGLPRHLTRALLNGLRSVPELVWAGLLLIAAGLGPLAGTLALAVHTTGVLGRLFAESIENAPTGPTDALKAQGVRGLPLFLYAVWPQVLPQLLSYTLYRWENNIRAAAVLGVVGAGGLGQMLAVHLGLFQMGKTATVLAAMLLLVACVDGLSTLARWRMTR